MFAAIARSLGENRRARLGLAVVMLLFAGLLAAVSQAGALSHDALMVKDINPGSASSSPGGAFTDVNGAVYFAANDGSHGTELWRSDGTAGGTILVKDIYPGSRSSSPSGLANVNGIIYFRASDGTSGAELWRSDGTAGGTPLVKDIYAGSRSSTPSGLANVNGTLFFRASDATSGAELWRSDG